MNILRLDRAQPVNVDSFQAAVITSIRKIRDGRQIDPTPVRQKRNFVHCASTIREVQKHLISGAVSRENKDFASKQYRHLDKVAAEIEAAADQIENRRGGGSEISRADKARKHISVRHASALIHMYGQCGTPTVTEGKPLLQLSKLLFEVATGKDTGSLKKPALAMFIKTNLHRFFGSTVRQKGG
ncbi:hypothetical protein WN73_12190 [Bradyrhizobium sp. CCBAU 45394]|uniref:hypothetical protein n=1 Tax=Bradyrhizobium sp. CCBAU 45394 TaxID=1325087 RepID=UPI0023045EE9|nr:hypothetical protein [Bradyrhizobium sp. CCBAU 45394]MDA9391408.1 hypothetical protein [Bradyrhizobium sp. CCBAU 45394]